MRVIYHRDGWYADNEESFRQATFQKAGASDIEMQEACAKRYDGNPIDFVVVSTEEPSPWLFKLVALEFVPDTGKIEAQAALIIDSETKSTRHAELQAKVIARAASLKELCEYILPE